MVWNFQFSSGHMLEQIVPEASDHNSLYFSHSRLDRSLPFNGNAIYRL